MPPILIASCICSVASAEASLVGDRHRNTQGHARSSYLEITLGLLVCVDMLTVPLGYLNCRRVLNGL